MAQPIIRITGLHVYYGKVGPRQIHALDDINLEVERGEIFGLLGPNGAGKTTLLSVLEGLRKPSTGQVIVDGLEVNHHAEQIKKQLGIQLQQTALLDDLTVYELIEFFAAIYDKRLTTSETHSLLDQFDLLEKSRTYPRHLSGGQRQRLALLLAIVNDPQIILLDEPTGALDPNARRKIWGLIRKLHEEGRTVMITTHSMEEAESLCRRVAIIDQGQLIAADSPSQLIAQLKTGSMIKTDLDLPLDVVQPLPGVLQARYSGQYLEVETHQPNTTLAALTDLAEKYGRRLGDVTLRQPNLEDVFLKLTGHPLKA